MTEFADIASYQHGADLTAYARSADRILIKATQGASYVTPDFRVWWPLARALGLARGAYHFVDPEGGNADAEAAHLLATVGTLGLRDWAVLDVEQPSGPNRSHGVYAAAVAQSLYARGVSAGMFYGSAPWFAAAGLTAAMVPPGWRRLHLAAYSATPDCAVSLPPGWAREQLYARQYTASASQPGIPGSSDRSRVVREWLTTGDDVSDANDTLEAAVAFGYQNFGDMFTQKDGGIVDMLRFVHDSAARTEKKTAAIEASLTAAGGTELLTTIAGLDLPSAVAAMQAAAARVAALTQSTGGA